MSKYCDEMAYGTCHGLKVVVNLEGDGIASNMGRGNDQGSSPDYRLVLSVPHNKIMLSGPTGIWFQWRG